MGHLGIVFEETHLAAKTSASFPLPSSPHWDPKIAQTRASNPAAFNTSGEVEN